VSKLFVGLWQLIAILSGNREFFAQAPLTACAAGVEAFLLEAIHLIGRSLMA
jgi:hypothetical protein